MNFFNRAIISVKRRPIKSLIFLLLVFLLGGLTAGAITVRQAINNTDANLRRQMPTIMTVVDAPEPADAETSEGTPQTSEVLTPALIREIAALPYVGHFDYAIDVGHWSVTSNDLEPWTPEDVMWPIMGSYDVELGTYIRPRGVSTPEFMEARDGLLTLIEGRTFTEEELTNRLEISPVLISSELARVNQLSVGSTFDSRLVIWDTGEESNLDGSIPMTEQGFSPIVDETFPMVIIGIFEADVPAVPTDNVDIGFPILNQVGAVHHRVYLPNKIAEEMMDLRIYGEVANDWWDEPFDATVINFFSLADPMDYQDFVRAVESLGGNWVVQDLSGGFREISISMETMRELADFILIGAISATLLVVSLVVLLFLRDRKHEIGVYLAMGDKKKNIVKQMILELIPLVVIGLTLSLFAGNIASGMLTRDMLQRDLSAIQPTNESVQMGETLENLGYRFSLSVEEMVASYDISLDTVMILMFYGIGLGTVLISTLIPIIFVVNVDPKRLLMEEKK